MPADRSLVFAYFDFSENKMTVNWAKIKQVSPVVAAPFSSMGYMRKAYKRQPYGVLVWHDNLSNGSYQIVTVGGYQNLWLREANVTLALGEMEKTELALRIEQPGIYFLGAYKYKPLMTTWAMALPGLPFKFATERTDSPSEAEQAVPLVKSLMKQPLLKPKPTEPLDRT